MNGEDKRPIDYDSVKHIVIRILDKQEDIMEALSEQKVISANLDSLKEQFQEYKKENSLDMNTFLSGIEKLSEEKLSKKDLKLMLGIVGGILTFVWSGIIFVLKAVNVLK